MRDGLQKAADSDTTTYIRHFRSLLLVAHPIFAFMSESRPTRFQASSTSLASFFDEIWVHAPEGAGPAVVRASAAWRDRTATLSTLGSAKRLHYPDHWFGPIWGSHHRFCPHCGIVGVMRSLNRARSHRQLPSEVTWRCRCGREASQPVTWHRTAQTAQPVDPFFGLPLWLQTTVKGQELWAYSARHLDYLETYIVAKLRERGDAHHHSLVSRLPRWMKLAANREAVLKGINRLRQRVPGGTRSA